MKRRSRHGEEGECRFFGEGEKESPDDSLIWKEEEMRKVQLGLPHVPLSS
jgi:hypothetical protein